jgi:tripartite tricarboxylate transporter TctB family protein
MTLRKANLVTGFFSIFLSIVIFTQAYNLKKGTGGFPQLISVILFVAGLILLIRTFNNKNEGKKVFEGISFRHIIPPLGFWILLIALMESIGFYLCAFIFLFTLTLNLYNSKLDLRVVIKQVLISFSIVLIIWLIFKLYLDMYMPEGIFVV